MSGWQNPGCQPNVWMNCHDVMGKVWLQVIIIVRLHNLRIPHQCSQELLVTVPQAAFSQLRVWQLGSIILVEPGVLQETKATHQAVTVDSSDTLSMNRFSC